MIIIRLYWWSEEKGLAELLSAYLGRTPDGACSYAESQLDILEMLGFHPIGFVVWDLPVQAV
jgi:hypothetical protein